MKTQEEKTKVIFRKFKDGDVIAMFPTIAGTNDYTQDCLSYQHLGQHSSASVDLPSHTKRVKEPEYRSLKKELEAIGYSLIIGHRFTRKDMLTRKAQVQQ
jgi:hypothetical protein